MHEFFLHLSPFHDPFSNDCVALPNLTEHFYNVQNEECGQKRNCPNDCVALPNLTEHFFNVQNEECGRKRNCPPILMPCVALPNITFFYCPK